MNKPRRRLGVVMDPIEKIHPKKDSTLAMLLAAQTRGWELIYLLQDGLTVKNGVAHGKGRSIRVAASLERWFEYQQEWHAELHELDALLMRKDPPFDMEFIYTTYILQLAEELGLLVVNRPASLRDMTEKAYTAWFPDCTPPNIISRSRTELLNFLAEHGRVVYKPLDGMGGRSIFVVSQGDINTNVVIETLTDNGRRFIVAQRYIPEISLGDKRILLIEGRPTAHALARIPAPGESRGNLVMGATGEGRELSERDRWICGRVGPVLAEKGVMFAGLDVIGDYLTEINVTSPTGIRELDKQYGTDIGDELIAAIEAKLARA